MSRLVRGISPRCASLPLVAMALLLGAPTRAHELRFVSGTFHGPGNLVDTPLPPGRLSHLVLSSGLDGRIEYFNNGPGLPNVGGEATLQQTADGLLSNGRPFNEHTDGGVVEVGRGAMRFLNVTAGDGPAKGISRTHLDADRNWHLIVDLVLDPGFPEGLLVIDQLDITTGAVHVPPSLQSAQGLAGGTDRAGSLASGVTLVGRAGDFDADGMLDGIFVGVTNIPLGHIFLPGAPAVQVRSFTTDIPLSPAKAALLALSSALNLKPVVLKRSAVDVSQLEELRVRLEAAHKATERSRSREAAALADILNKISACHTRGQAGAQLEHGCATALSASFDAIQAVTSRLATSQ
jgi:hypothetical protein